MLSDGNVLCDRREIHIQLSGKEHYPKALQNDIYRPNFVNKFVRKSVTGLVTVLLWKILSTGCPNYFVHSVHLSKLQKTGLLRFP